MVRGLLSLVCAGVAAGSEEVCAAEGCRKPLPAKDNVMLQLSSGSVSSLPSKPCGVNLAFGKPVSCSGNVERCNGRLTDGSSAGNTVFSAPRAVTLGEQETAWVQVDLGAVTSVDEVTVFQYPGTRYRGKKLEVSIDGQTWQAVRDFGMELGEAETDQGLKIAFEEVEQARYVRFHCGQAEQLGAHRGATTSTPFLDLQVTCRDQNRCCASGQLPFERGVNRQCTGDAFTFNEEEYNARRAAELALPASYDYYAEEPELPPACNGWATEGRLTEEQCWQMCLTNAQAPHCPERECAAMRYTESWGACHLYEPGQCDEVTTAPGNGIILRKKILA